MAGLRLIPPVEGGYRTVLIDPPWQYRQDLSASSVRGSVAQHRKRKGYDYEVMSLEELRAMPIAQVAAKDCQLWIWTTNAFLHEAFHLIEAWGFTHRTTLTWAKGRVEGGKLITQIGLGYWLRGATEHLLLATRGHPRARMTGPHGATGTGASTLLLAPKTGHSIKPEGSYRVIEGMSEEPRLELFARRRRPGWIGVGDQLRQQIFPVDTVKAAGGVQGPASAIPAEAGTKAEP